MWDRGTSAKKPVRPDPVWKLSARGSIQEGFSRGFSRWMSRDWACKGRVSIRISMSRPSRITLIPWMHVRDTQSWIECTACHHGEKCEESRTQASLPNSRATFARGPWPQVAESAEPNEHEHWNKLISYIIVTKPINILHMKTQSIAYRYTYRAQEGISHLLCVYCRCLWHNHTILYYAIL